MFLDVNYLRGHRLYSRRGVRYVLGLLLREELSETGEKRCGWDRSDPGWITRTKDCSICIYQPGPGLFFGIALATYGSTL